MVILFVLWPSRVAGKIAASGHPLFFLSMHASMQWAALCFRPFPFYFRACLVCTLRFPYQNFG
jgi:hypothetical protein